MKLKELNCGLKLLAVPMKNTNTVTALIIVGTGTKYEAKETNGISHFLEHMFFKGTKKRPNNLAISSELDGMGAEFNAFTTKEFTGFWVKSENKNLKSILDIISDMLINSQFSAAEIDRERGVILEEINMYQDSPMYMVEDVFENCLYGDTPAGWNVLGEKENITRLIRDDFIKYVHSQYGSRNTIVCLIGNLGSGEAQVEKLVNKYFGADNFKKWGGNFNEKPAVLDKQEQPQAKVHYKETDQAHLALGVRTFGYGRKEKTIVKMISIILGGSMSSRIWSNLRERHGLGYYVHTSNETYSDVGYLVTRAGVKIEEITKAITIILSEYKRMVDSLVEKKELQRTKDLLRGRLALQLETSDNLAEWYGRQAILNHTLSRTAKKTEKIIAPAEYVKEIEKITVADIRRVAQQIFINQHLNLAIIGPFKDKSKFETILKLN